MRDCGKPRSYIPPLTKHGAAIDLFNPTFLCSGVMGYAIKQADGRIFIPDIHAVEKNMGDVGRLLDSLSPNCCVVNVCSSRLRAMLQRRGWIVEYENVPKNEGGGTCDVWQKPGLSL